MKNSIFNLIVFTFILTIISCSSISDKPSIYERIATDEIYETLSESFSEHALLLTTDQIDLDAIEQYVYANPEITSCEFDDEILGQIKGGLDYKRLSCKMRQARNILREKYPEYRDFTLSDTRELRNAYKENGSSSSEVNALTIIEHINY